MKLIFAIVQDEDVDNLVDALVAEDFRVTRIGSTGSFLRMGNSSLMLGVEDHDVPRVMSVVRRICRRRKQMAVPYSPALEPGLLYMPENFEVEVGGAVLLIHNVERYERIKPGTSNQ
ncbi:MAG: cyclic-di-AMP receptor [Chloroflexota bacterium]